MVARCYGNVAPPVSQSDLEDLHLFDDRTLATFIGNRAPLPDVDVDVFVAQCLERWNDRRSLVWMD